MWGDDNIQEQLEGSKQNKHVYDQIAEDLKAYGIEKTGEQCRCKIKKLQQEYKKIKDQDRETGNNSKQWKYYDKVNEILGNRPSVVPPVLVDSLDSSASTDKVTSDDDPNGDMSDNEQEGSSKASSDKDEATKSVLPKSGSILAGIKGKKRKRGKGEVMEEVMTKAMKTVSDSLKETEKMFVELEDK